MKIRPADGSVLATYATGDGAAGLAADTTSRWVVNNGSSTVTRLDRANRKTIATYTSGRGPFGIAFDGRRVWVANVGSDSVSTTLVQ
jgi:YVTN family beta-propeller protein